MLLLFSTLAFFLNQSIHTNSFNRNVLRSLRGPAIKTSHFSRGETFTLRLVVPPGMLKNNLVFFMGISTINLPSAGDFPNFWTINSIITPPGVKNGSLAFHHRRERQTLRLWPPRRSASSESAERSREREKRRRKQQQQVCLGWPTWNGFGWGEKGGCSRNIHWLGCRCRDVLAQIDHRYY